MASKGDSLQPDGTMVPGDELLSRSGTYRLLLQADGNLVLYRTRDRAALWATGTQEEEITALMMVPNGNLILVKKPITNLLAWESRTAGHPGAHLLLQDDGNLVIYDGNRPIWATNTAGL